LTGGPQLNFADNYAPDRYQEPAKRSLVVVSTENLYRLAAQLRRQLQQTRLTPALPGEVEPPVAPALNPN